MRGKMMLLANKYFLAMSISLSVNFFWGMSDDRVFRVLVTIGIIAVESLAQYILSLARWAIKSRKKALAGILLFLYAWYFVVFGFFSGVSYFVSTIAREEKTLARQEFLETAQQDLWRVNIKLTEAYAGHLETEKATGYGRRSQAATEEIKNLKKELGKILEEAEEKTEEPPAVNQFDEVARVFSLSPHTFKIFIYGTLVVFIFVGLILTNPDLKRPVTLGVTQGVTPVTGDVTTRCQGCNKVLPPGWGRRYCDEACKQRAYRARKKKGEKEE